MLCYDVKMVSGYLQKPRVDGVIKGDNILIRVWICRRGTGQDKLVLLSSDIP